MTQTPMPHRIEIHHVLPPGYVRALQRLGVAQTGSVPLLHRIWPAR
jgi:hypothetical protein